jgi:cytochrome c oxidase subunit II
MSYLVILVAILGIWAFVQLANIMQLTSQLKDTEDEVVTESDSKFNSRLMLLFGIGLIVFFFWQIKEYSSTILPVSASEHGSDIDTLWDFNIYIVTLVFILVNAVLFYFAYKYKYTKKNKSYFFCT